MVFDRLKGHFLDVALPVLMLVGGAASRVDAQRVTVDTKPEAPGVTMVRAADDPKSPYSDPSYLAAKYSENSHSVGIVVGVGTAEIGAGDKIGTILVNGLKKEGVEAKYFLDTSNKPHTDISIYVDRRLFNSRVTGTNTFPLLTILNYIPEIAEKAKAVVVRPAPPETGPVSSLVLQKD